MSTFKDLNLSSNILKAIEELNYTNPTPIQEKAIPFILSQKDLMGCAQTGTGKTAAFAIPIINILEHETHIHHKKSQPKCLVVTPTRELAIQVFENFVNYAKYTPLKTVVLFGGVSQNEQVRLLSKGVDILVATPGRLLDLFNQSLISLDKVKILVLDEADQMLDMGFVHDIKKIVKLIPTKRQTLFFSATMPSEIKALADSFLQKPEYVSVAPSSSTAETVEQAVYLTNRSNKRSLLVHIIKSGEMSQVLVFTRTKYGADNLVKFLKKNQLKAAAIHGDKSQNARQRVLEEFKKNELDILVATDIAARGIDINALPYVINYDLPNVAETYVHRIGRTGRAGKEGISISICDEEDQSSWDGIKKLTKINIPVIKDHPYPRVETVANPNLEDKKANAPKKDFRGFKGKSGGNKFKKKTKNDSQFQPKRKK